MLHVLKDRLHQAEQLLNQTLFSDFWQGLTVELNRFFYHEVSTQIYYLFILFIKSILFHVLI